MVSCSSDHSVKVWDVHTRQCVQTFSDVHSDQVRVRVGVRVGFRVRVNLPPTSSLNRPCAMMQPS